MFGELNNLINEIIDRFLETCELKTKTIIKDVYPVVKLFHHNTKIESSTTKIFIVKDNREKFTLVPHTTKIKSELVLIRYLKERKASSTPYIVVDMEDSKKLERVINKSKTYTLIRLKWIQTVEKKESFTRLHVNIYGESDLIGRIKTNV